MKTNKTYRFMLAFALMAGLGMSGVSCSDDEVEVTEEQKEQQALEQDELTTRYWAVVSQLAGSDSYCDDWQDKTFEPIIGQETNGNPAVRTVITGDLETAEERFRDLIGDAASGFTAGTKEYTFTDEHIGTLTYRQTGGASLATVDVDIKQMPGLARIEYKTPDQAGANGTFTGTAYYRFGDVVSKVEDGETDYWICVRPAFGTVEGKEDSHWISLSPLHGKYIKEATCKGEKQYLPTNLCTSKEHIANLAELLYAIYFPRFYDDNLAADYKNLKYFNDFHYEKTYDYNNSFFFEQVYNVWSTEGFIPSKPKRDLAAVVLGVKGDALLKAFDTGLNFIYEGGTIKNDRVQLKRYTFYGKNMKSVDANSFSLSLNYDVRTVYEEDNHGDRLNYFKAPVIVNDRQYNDTPNFFVRYKTGKELCKGTIEPANYDKRQRLTNCTDVYVYNRDVAKLDMSDLRNTPPQVTSRIYTPHYKLGDVYEDEQGNRWFVANMGGVTREGSDYAELISFEGFDTRGKNSVANLPTREQVQRGTAFLWDIYISICDKSMDVLRSGTLKRLTKSMLNIYDYADIDIRRLFQSTTAASGNPRQASHTCCVAYEEPDYYNSNQKLLRFITNNQNEANDFTFWIWDSYPQNPSPDEQFQRVFTNRKIELQDISKLDMIAQYAEDHYARRPLENYSNGDPERPMREPRDEVEEQAEDVTKYFYFPLSWDMFLNPTSMWNEPVLFYRMTAVYDRGEANYRTKTVDGHTLTPVHLVDWYDEEEDEDSFSNTYTFWSVLYSTVSHDRYHYHGVNDYWPSWTLWRAYDPLYKP